MEKSIYILVFNNSVLSKIIFKYVNNISSLNGRKHFSWNEVVRIPHVLVAHNYSEQLKQCMSSNTKIDRAPTLKLAIRFGSTEMLSYLINRLKLDLNSYQSWSTSQSYFGFGDMSDHFPEHCDTINSILCYASQHGRMDIVQYLVAKYTRYQWNYYRAMVMAPLSDSLEMLKYFTEKHNNTPNERFDNYEFISTVFETAAFMGRIDMFEYLLTEREKDLKKSKVVCRVAVNGGHLQLVEYLLKNHRDLVEKESSELSNILQAKRIALISFASCLAMVFKRLQLV
ncbi:hypothetical protein PPL_12065 [Heterostelium album PN500]|uniref:Ankyrin repeat protein n=1 Tax=Heterostelium pallidum (strain ATCC 26659 / Pp 5 / PN500) TaxID=670386 RepID=D3BLL2_HETP5|nr:hypothetical protein PPL_12065 [Heterostelium album PN500]EFA77463.1 hypothetical protein PPL_12065 [Heterostelium album PN500]|eukprot:XP_020429591.1 hypothetical protein PPL_12065 [Heterostelium album PN500]